MNQYDNITAGNKKVCPIDREKLLFYLLEEKVRLAVRGGRWIPVHRLPHADRNKYHFISCLIRALDAVPGRFS